MNKTAEKRIRAIRAQQLSTDINIIVSPEWTERWF